MGQNFVTINGKHYDAKTGRLIEASSVAKHVPTHAKQPKQNGPSLDGFSRRNNSPKPVAPAHKVHHKTEKSKTLMRGVVKKPADTKIRANAHAVNSHHKQATPHVELPKNHARVARASGIAKSALISRFGNSAVSAQKSGSHHKSVAHLPVKHAPAITAHHAAPLPVNQSFPNPFASAVSSATSHEQEAPRKLTKRHRVARALRITPRTLSFGSFVIAGLLLGGFFVSQNIPNLAMRVAAARSGVSAGLPSYKPAGFALSGPIKYSTGKISISYRSTTDERAYQVTQSNSEWNSETLLENYVAVDRRPYQTYQDKGKTIYIYEDSNATWVDQGVWYQVEGKSSLNSDQLLRIANSL